MLIRELFKITDIHQKRIIFSMDKLANIFPISVGKIQNLSEQEFLLIELLTTRFSKLQDFMGNKII
jgi:hypothetical protein